jgi:hypothetical protein
MPPTSGMKRKPRKTPSRAGLSASAGFLLTLHFEPEEVGNVPQKCIRRSLLHCVALRYTILYYIILYYNPEGHTLYSQCSNTTYTKTC